MEIVKYRTELGRDRHNILVKESIVDYGCEHLCEPEKISDMLNTVYSLNRLAEEHVYMLGMTSKCGLLGVFEISHGTISESIINPREIFIRLLLCGASMFTIVHNHPSGDALPSEEDLKVTERIKACALLMGIKLIDHIIVGETYYSFMEHDML